MINKIISQNFFLLICTVFISSLFLFLIIPLCVQATVTNGTIDTQYRYAWGENIGWLDFGTTQGNVVVSDLKLSGSALSENVGWINLDNVINDGTGTLSGYAWGENVGWINFKPTNGGVTINTNGEFSGSALSENVGWLNFDTDYKVKTDWRPRTVRPACNNTYDDDGDGLTDYPNDAGCASLDDDNEINPGLPPPVMESVGAGEFNQVVPMNESKPVGQITAVGTNLLMYINSAAEFKTSSTQSSSAGGSSNTHQLKIVDLNMITKKIKVEIKSDPVIVELALGEVKEIDIDHDGKKDIKLAYNNLTVNRIDLTVQQTKSVSTINSLFVNGTLVKEKNQPTVYYLSRNQKFPLANEQTFLKFNFKWSNIKEYSDLSSLPLASTLATDSSLPLTTSYKFTSNLSLGSRGLAVKELQKFLNNNGYPVALSGPGSIAEETEIFGSLTKQALIKFQKANKLNLATGSLNIATRNLINQ